MKKKQTIDFSSLLDPEPCSIVRRLVDAGHEAYIVGGAVRDLLLGEKPKDYDITTSATPEEVRQVFGRRHCVVIGRRFRLALVLAGGTQYEVSTFRTTPANIKTDENGNAIIWDDNTFGTQEEDSMRRDFTVNAIYYDVTGKRGLIDLAGGMADIKKKTVRCIGDPEVRFNEDPVRMLRALKLCGQYGFKLSAPVKKALKKNQEKIRLASPARLFEELLKILVSPKSIMILSTLQEYGFLEYFWPTLSQSWDEDEGIWFRQIMEARCNALKNDAGYPHSKGLALATACFAFQMSAMNSDNTPRLWSRTPNCDMITGKVIQLVFDGFSLPKIFMERMNTIMNMVPKITRKPISQKALRHVEYRNGLALADILAATFDWEKDGLDLLHNPNFSMANIILPKSIASNATQEANEQKDNKPETASGVRSRKHHRSRRRHKTENPELQQGE